MAFTQNEIDFFLKLPDFIAVGEADHTYDLPNLCWMDAPY